MSLKDTYKLASSVKNISDMSEEQLASEVESVGYHEQDVIHEDRFIPRIDFSRPENFAYYGSAAEYYKASIGRVYGTYPYDGSLKEKLEWENNSTYIDLYLLDNQYPRTNGFIILSADGWGASSGPITADGYGTPSTREYISFIGGPNQNPHGMSDPMVQFTGSNYWDPAKNRASNLEFNLRDKGVSVEFWLKKDQFITGSTEKEVIFDLWNNKLSSSVDYGRLSIELTGATDGLNPFRLTILSGTTGFQDVSIGSATLTTASVADNNWHHYAITCVSTSVGVNTKFYVNGDLNNEQTLGSVGINQITGTLKAHIGALITSPSGSAAMMGAGKLSASLDEFRYWKKQRSSKDIGRYWISQVGGGTNSDPAPGVDTTNLVNTDLGVYYKFNEGITGIDSTDRMVLDYSGRISNGTWTGYTSNSRNTGSAIVISRAAIKEFKDPIIYSFHPAVVALEAKLEGSGSRHDIQNNASIYNSIPGWILEEDEEASGELKSLAQIMGSYFDTLQLQIQSLNTLKDITYPHGSQKPLPFANRLLESAGLVSPELFIDADVLEKLADRSEDLIYDKSLSDIKNTIYQNIYNNLNYIYKSKGTEKAFRNLIRCFGIDDELIKFNLYANNIEYEYRNNARAVVEPKKFVDFNTIENIQGSVYQFLDSSNANSVSFITGSTNLTGGFAFTTEVDLVMPIKAPESHPYYISRNFISASIFGMHSALPNGADTTWTALDESNFQVFAVRDELRSPNVRFVLTSTAGGSMPLLKSDLYEDVYNNTRWNLAVRVRPEKYPYENFVTSSVAGDYIVELRGTHVQDGVVLDTFTLSGTINSPPAGFISDRKRLFAGSHRQNFTGSVLEFSDVKVAAARHWLTYLDDTTLTEHANDAFNYGTSNPHWYAFPFQPEASFGEIPELDTLALNWDFNQNTGSNSSGQFSVADLSSGSTQLAASRYDWLGPILNNQHTGRGDFFGANSTTAIDKDYIVNIRQNLPENLRSVDMISVLTSEEQEEFTPATRPVTFYFSFEKSLYQVISEEMINYFATIRDMHTLIGAPVNRYRMDYKDLSKVRQAFFLNVQNSTIDFDKFYEFYKWFDSSLSTMLQQLVPASADVAQNIRTMIESHILERNKYHSKFPTLNTKDPIIEGRICNILDPLGGWKFNHHPLNNLQSTNAYWWKDRATRLKPPLASGDAAVDFSREKIFESAGPQRPGYADDRSQFWDDNCADSRPYKLSVSRPLQLPGGNPRGQYPNKIWDFVFPATYPAGPLIKGMNIPANVMLTFEKDVETLKDITDIITPNQKKRLAWGINARINKHQSGSFDYQEAKGHLLAPFNLYSSSVATGYNQTVRERFMKGVMITDLHNDIYGELNGSPLQGPFTEQYVGGREYRHVALNKFDALKKGPNNLDYVEDRPEGFKLLLGMCDDSPTLVSVTSGSVTSGTAGFNAKKVLLGNPYNGGNNTFQPGWNMSPASFPTFTPLTVSTWFSASHQCLGSSPDRMLWQLGRDSSPATQGQIQLQWTGPTGSAGGGRFEFNAKNDPGPDTSWILDEEISDSKYLTEGPGWYHVILAYTSGSSPPTVFINGVSASYSSWVAPAGNLVDIAPSSGSIGVDVLNATGYPNVQTTFLSGAFSDLAIWNRHLSDSECVDLYGSGSGTTVETCTSTTLLETIVKTETTVISPGPIDITSSGPLSTGLMSWFRFGDTPGDTGPEVQDVLGGPSIESICDSPSIVICPFHLLDYTLADQLVAGAASSVTCETTSSVYSYIISGALGIVDPQYPSPNAPAVSPPYLFDRPKGNLLRNVGTKRPVNVQNIQMTTGSTILGNYRMNYDVVQSNARSINDLFFREQSFDFSLYPLTVHHKLDNSRPPLALSGDRVVNTKAIELDDQPPGLRKYWSWSGSAPEIAYMNANTAETWQAWINLTASGQTNILFQDSDGVHAGDNFDTRRIETDPDNKVVFLAKWDGGGTTAEWESPASAIPLNKWTHLAITYNGSSTSNSPTMYIDGAPVPVTEVVAPVGTIDPYVMSSAYIYIGWHTGENWAGYVSDASFWNTTLTSDQANKLYSQATLNLLGGELIAVRSNLIFWFRMGDGPGDSIAGIANIVGGASADLVHVGTPPGIIVDINPQACTRFGDKFALPNRDGRNSNQTIFVNKFSAPGGYEVQSRGYLEPAHEEVSPYNALPFRNRSVIDYGLSGSASVDPLAAQTITVVDQIGKNRGRNQRLTLHCGQFGHDAAYGTIPTDTYVTVPSYHKVNRNTKYRMETGSYFTASVYDNGWVTHPIPQSTRQYAWITASLAPDTMMLGYMGLSGGLPQSFPTIQESEIYSFRYLTMGTNYRWWGLNGLGGAGVPASCGAWSGASAPVPTDFVGMNTIIVDPPDGSSQTLGYPSMSFDPSLGMPADWFKSNYINSSFNSGNPSDPGYGILGWPPGWLSCVPGSAGILNSILLNRGGPYGWPTWKQIRTRQHPVVRYQREHNILSQRDEALPIYVGDYATAQQMRGLKGNTFKQYVEQPISSRHHALEFAFEGGQWNNIPGVPDAYNQMWASAPGTPIPPDNSVVAKVSWGNNIDYFSHQRLDNRLDLVPNVTFGQPYETLVNFALDASLNNSADSLIEYTERIYPREVNAYRTRTRTREEYSTDQIWLTPRGRRSQNPGWYLDWRLNAVGTMVPNASMWPLDAHYPFSSMLADISQSTLPILSWGGTGFSAGELQNRYTRFGTYQGCQWQRANIAPGPLYNMRVFVGSGSSPGVGMGNCDPVWGGDTYWDAPVQAGKDPYQPYEEYAEFIRLKGKDHTIVPEFRISEHIENLVINHNSDWLTDLDETTGLFDLTGGEVPEGEGGVVPGTQTDIIANSSQNNFYSVYGHTDFLKYFKVIDDDLNNKNINEGMRLKRKEIQLGCSAYIKFLPYKGFYPAERATALTGLFSSSYFPHVESSFSSSVTGWQHTTAGPETRGAMRPLLEPLFAPGILFNTIKSGIAVSSFVIFNTSSTPKWDIGLVPKGESMLDIGAGSGGPSDLAGTKIATSTVWTTLPEGTINFGVRYSSSLNPQLNQNNFTPPASWAPPATPGGWYVNYLDAQGGYGFQRIPFEAMIKPSAYFGVNSISGAYIYDNGLPPSASFRQDQDPTRYKYRVGWNGMGSSLYELAIDNFLCETLNFFQDDTFGHMANFVSAREDEFASVTSGSYYAMTVDLRRPIINPGGDTTGSGQLVTIPDRSKFEMYERASAFGPPFAGNAYAGAFSCFSPGSACAWEANFDPLTPSYYDGHGRATILFKAQYSGKPALSDILATSEFIYARSNNTDDPLSIQSWGVHGPSAGSVWQQHIDQNVNLAETLISVPPDTDSNQDRWLIQSKFETPVLNFSKYTVSGSAASASITLPPNSLVPGSPHPLCPNTDTLSKKIISKGMWHQYGDIPAGGETIELSVDTPSYINSPTHGVLEEDNINSLASVVKFNTGSPKPVGNLRRQQTLAEAIIVVPFTVNQFGTRRSFFKLTEDMHGPGQASYLRCVDILRRYILPPKFDFVTNPASTGPTMTTELNPLSPVNSTGGPTMTTRLNPLSPVNSTGGPTMTAQLDPLSIGAGGSPTTISPEKILFYAFEFSVSISRQDLADIWQNLPPNIGTQFQKPDPLFIREKNLIDEMYNPETTLRWLVFKVKKRAEKDYNVFVKKNLTTDLATIPPNIESKYSYNWPYDYFSLVELVKIDTTVQYSPETAAQMMLDPSLGQDLLFPPSLGSGTPPLNILGQPYGSLPSKEPPSMRAPSLPLWMSPSRSMSSSGALRSVQRILQMMTKKRKI